MFDTLVVGMFLKDETLLTPDTKSLKTPSSERYVIADEDRTAEPLPIIKTPNRDE